MDQHAHQETSPSPASYEFDSQQNRVIEALASAMRWVATPLIFLGIMYAIATVVCVVQAFRDPASLLGAVYVGIVAIIALSLAHWTRQAASSFDKVVSTGDRDIVHLMHALDNLRRKYSLLSFFVKIYVAILLVALIAGLTVAIMGAFKS
jgi:hypothetical protein